MQPTPSPRSISDAPAFFFTTPPDFFLAISTDHTPAGAGTGLYSPPAASKKARPELAEASSTYQDFFPAASSFSALAATGRPSFFMRATVASTPAASHSSKGPDCQLKPSFMARSLSPMEPALSPTRLPAHF